jgi:hypothetical protein
MFGGLELKLSARENLRDYNSNFSEKIFEGLELKLTTKRRVVGLEITCHREGLRD